jgi:hypothetical protein
MTNHYYNFVQPKEGPFLALRWSYLSWFEQSGPLELQSGVAQVVAQGYG